MPKFNNLLRFLKKLMTGLMLVALFTGSYLYAFEPEYGAYPPLFHPNEIAGKMEIIALKYKKGNADLSPASKQMLIDGLTLSTEVTQNQEYNRIAEEIGNRKTTKPDPDFTNVQKEQMEIYRKLISMSFAQGTTHNRDLANSLIRNFQENETKIIDDLLTNSQQAPDYLRAGLYLFNTLWGINRSAGMMWLYNYKVPSIRSYLILSGTVNEYKKKGKNNFDAFNDAALLLAFAEAYRLSVAMSFPPTYVMTERYAEDLKQLEEKIDRMRLPNKGESLQFMRKAAEAQMKNLFMGSAADTKDPNRGWYRGALFTGISAAWKATEDKWYLSEALDLSEKTSWKPGPNAIHDANDLAISQMYLELFEKEIPVAQIQPTKLILDSLIEVFNPRVTEWSWCDALFMAPPTWARMGKITGETKYFDQMDKLWWQTSDLLYDKEDHLFYRDLKYVAQEDGFQIKERNGEKIFWGRGNGWVIGGLCRVLEYLPQDYPSLPKYEKMFQDMCKALLETQDNNGLWRVSLLDPDSYPMGETSSSTFNCYAFAWGINHGLLDKLTYKPATLKAWKALSACLNDVTGLLEYVQLPADSPLSPLYKSTNSEYATGAYLLAGSEIIHLLD